MRCPKVSLFTLALYFLLGFANLSHAVKIPIVPNGTLGPFRHGTYPSLGDKTHAGVDILAPCGSEIYAFADGQLIDVIDDANTDNFDSLGYMVIVQHSPHTLTERDSYTLYLHMEAPPPVGRDDHVTGGKTVIGKVGKTGTANNICHTHFEIRYFAPRFSDWHNIYGPGDQRQSKYFKSNWEDPVAWFEKFPEGKTVVSGPIGERERGKRTTPTEAGEEIVKIDNDTELLKVEMDQNTGIRFSLLYQWGYVAPHYRTSKNRDDTMCNGYWIPVIGEVPGEIDLTDETLVQSIISKAKQYAFRICPNLRAKKQQIWISLYSNTFDKSRIEKESPIFARFDPYVSPDYSRLREDYKNRIAEAATRQRAEEEKQRRQQEEERRLAEKQKAGEIRSLPQDTFLVLLGTDTKTGSSFWAYSRKSPEQCWAFTGGIRDVYAEVPRNVALHDDELGRSLVMMGEQFSAERCRDNALYTEVFVLHKGYRVDLLAGDKVRLSPTAVWGNVSRWQGAFSPQGPPRLTAYRNYALEALAAEQEKARRERERKETRRRYDEFAKKNGVQAWPNMSELSVNPFVYENRIIAFSSYFHEMLSATDGLFRESFSNFYVVSNMPKGLLTSSGRVVVAGKVIGKTEVNLPLLGRTSTVRLKFVDLYICRDRNCADILGWAK